MTGTGSQRDFFISYTSADRAWAEWVAWQLEDAGWATVLQAWDFVPGGELRRADAGCAAPLASDTAAAETQRLEEEMAHYLFNVVNADAATETALREQTAGFLRVRMWGIDVDEPHRDALAPGDLVLLYLGAPDREFIGRAELASAVHDWTPSEARVYPGDSPGGVLLAEVQEWDPPVPMNTVLSQIDPAENAKADFQVGVVRITANEYETALAVAARRAAWTG